MFAKFVCKKRKRFKYIIHLCVKLVAEHWSNCCVIQSMVGNRLGTHFPVLINTPGEIELKISDRFVVTFGTKLLIQMKSYKITSIRTQQEWISRIEQEFNKLLPDFELTVLKKMHWKQSKYNKLLVFIHNMYCIHMQ